MGKYIIKGGKKLKGIVKINGSKNSALPMLAAAILNGSISVFENCPDISDTKTAVSILKYIGCAVEKYQKTVIINSANVSKTEIPDELVKKMRSSIVFMGALLARFKKVSISHPGGCELGKRPIDLHLSAFEKMGVLVEEKGDVILCSCDKLKGCSIDLDFPSVGATQNIILAGVLAEGITTIKNCAKEPEISDLCEFLIKCGAKIEGYGTSEIKIIGVEKLKPANHFIIPDRIEAGTYLIMAAATKGKITLENVEPNHLEALTNLLLKMGCKIKSTKNTITLKAPKKLLNVPFIKTQPYPGIPTDLQPQLTVLAVLSKGICKFNESIFENRTGHILELLKMGADINLINEREFFIKGKKGISNQLLGKEVSAKDLRCGAALITAGLAAKETTVVYNSYHVERGYENIVENLLKLGANITLKN